MEIRYIYPCRLSADIVDGVSVVRHRDPVESTEPLQILCFGPPGNIGLAESAIERPAELVALLNCQAEVYAEEYRYRLNLEPLDEPTTTKRRRLHR